MLKNEYSKLSSKGIVLLNQKFLLFVSALLCSANLCAQSLSIYCEDDTPLQFVGADGKLTGFSIEIVQEIQKRVGNTDQIHMVPWARGLGILNTEPNSILFSMARTAERDAQYQWIGPITETTYGFYVKADSPLKITSREEAKKVGLIGVYRDDVRDQFLTRQGFTNLDRANSNVSSFRKLMLGRNAMYADSPLGVKGLAEKAGYKLTDVRVAYNFLKIQLYIAASKQTDPALVAKWNAALESMKKESAFMKIHRKYFPDLAPPGPAITKF
jgi:polar amino acid transport system substrate-binding protein